MYFLVHNKLPTRERLFRFFSVNDPYCSTCLDANMLYIADRVHYFCECVKVNEVWQAVKNLMVEVSDNELARTDNFDLLTLRVPNLKNRRDSELVWIVSTYVFEVWNQLHEKEVSNISKEMMFGFLRFKYRSYQYGARPLLSILGLSQQ